MLFDKNNKDVKFQYSVLQGIKNEREKNKEAEKRANDPISNDPD